MRLFSSTEFRSLEDLLTYELEDLYDAEKRLTQALPKMAEAASSRALQAAFREHLGETEEHVMRLEQVFAQLGQEPERETCDAMKGLIAEGQEIVNATGDPAVKDAALIAAAQRVEHYEIAGYGCARNFAQRLGHTEAAALLQRTLDEESATDRKLTRLAEQSINPSAGRSGM